MSKNCIQCVKNERTGPDLLCDKCRERESIPGRNEEHAALVKATAAKRGFRIDG